MSVTFIHGVDFHCDFCEISCRRIVAEDDDGTYRLPDRPSGWMRANGLLYCDACWREEERRADEYDNVHAGEPPW